jgi:hypothetical protein
LLLATAEAAAAAAVTHATHLYTQGERLYAGHILATFSMKNTDIDAAVVAEDMKLLTHSGVAAPPLATMAAMQAAPPTAVAIDRAMDMPVYLLISLQSASLRPQNRPRPQSTGKAPAHWRCQHAGPTP